MKGIYMWSRALAGFFGLTTLLSVLWFSASQGKIFVTASMFMGFASVAVAVVPPRTLSNKAVVALVTVFCIVGIGAGLVLVANDLSGPLNKTEWDVAAVRLLHIGALGVLAAKALKMLPDRGAN